jgi:hypothetical protein
VPDLGVRGSGGTAQRLLFVLVQIDHVEIAMLLEPVLVGLDRQRPHQPQAALGIGKDAHDVGTALKLLIVLRGEQDEKRASIRMRQCRRRRDQRRV